MALKKNIYESLDVHDPIILKTLWTALSLSSQDFKSHRLVQVNNHRLEFKMSLIAFFIYTSTTFIGLFIIILTIVDYSSLTHSFLSFLLGAFFMTMGIILFYVGNKKIVLDKNIMALWRGKEDMGRVINPKKDKGFTSLKKLHAVQLLKEYIDNTDSKPYYQHELNLVFDDAKRINIIHCGCEKSISKQGEIVSQFFDIPLWDGRLDEKPHNYSESQKRVENIVVNTIGMIILIISSLVIYLIFF